MSKNYYGDSDKIITEDVNNRNNKYKWGTAIIVCMSIFIVVLDGSSMIIGIKTIVNDLNTSVVAIQTIVAVYSLIVASLILTSSKIQDIIGRKKTFLTGIIIFSIGAIITSLSINSTMLFIGWSLLKGIGGALILPTTTNILGSSYKGQDRATAFGIWGGILAMGSAVGPIFGGFFITFLSWRLVSVFELIFVAIILIFSYYIKESSGIIKWKDFDYFGSILSFLAIFFLVLGVLLLSKPNYLNYAYIIIPIGLIFLTIFILSQKYRIKKKLSPISNISLFKNKGFALGTFMNLLQITVLGGFSFIMPVFLQEIADLNAFSTGLLLLPTSLILMFVSFIGPKLNSYLSPKYILAIGFLISSVSLFILSSQFTLNIQPISIVPGAMLYGVGGGLILSQLTNYIMSSVGDDEQSDASGILNVFKNLGRSIGIGLVGILFLSGMITGLTTDFETSNMINNMSSNEIHTKIFDYFENSQVDDSGNISKISPTPKVKDFVYITFNSTIHMIFSILSGIFLINVFLSFLLPNIKED